jgi:hypothetical protein
MSMIYNYNIGTMAFSIQAPWPNNHISILAYNNLAHQPIKHNIYTKALPGLNPHTLNTVSDQRPCITHQISIFTCTVLSALYTMYNSKFLKKRLHVFANEACYPLGALLSSTNSCIHCIFLVALTLLGSGIPSLSPSLHTVPQRSILPRLSHTRRVLTHYQNPTKVLHL